MPTDPPDTDPSEEARQRSAGTEAGADRVSAPEPEEKGDDTSAGDALSWSRALRPLRRPLQALTAAAVGLFALAFFYTLYFASGFFLPVVIALVLNLLFRPAVRTMKRAAGLPDPLGAALIVLVLAGAAGYGLYELSGPAARWAEEVPEYLRTAEQELRSLFEPVQSVSESAEEVEQRISGDESDTATVQVQPSSISSAILGQTQQLLVGAAIVFFLLYFLLASGDFFLRKFVHVVPLLRRKRIAVRIAHRAEDDLSTYLSTYAVINTVLGTVVGTVLYLLGMPNPVLWGVMVGALNFMPYLGAVIGVSIVALVALVSIESTGRALAAPFLYFVINSLEGNLVTPLILGKRLQLNPVAIFISLTFWGWIWGVAGALLATPLLVSLKVVCDNVITLRPLGEFIGR